MIIQTIKWFAIGFTVSALASSLVWSPVDPSAPLPEEDTAPIKVQVTVEHPDSSVTATAAELDQLRRTLLGDETPRAENIIFVTPITIQVTRHAPAARPKGLRSFPVPNLRTDFRAPSIRIEKPAEPPVASFL